MLASPLSPGSWRQSSTAEGAALPTNTAARSLARASPPWRMRRGRGTRGESIKEWLEAGADREFKRYHGPVRVDRQAPRSRRRRPHQVLRREGRVVEAWSVVISELRNLQLISRDPVDHSVLIIDPAGPIPRQGMLQRLRLPRSFEWSAHNLADESIDSTKYLLVRPLPDQVVFPGVFGEDDPHSTSSRSRPCPSESSAIDSSSRRAFLGARSRYAVSSRAS